MKTSWKTALTSLNLNFDTSSGLVSDVTFDPDELDRELKGFSFRVALVQVTDLAQLKGS